MNSNSTGGDFYNGMEWMAAWLIDHAEGETVTEELARLWAVEAWNEHLKRNAASEVLLAAPELNPFSFKIRNPN